MKTTKLIISVALLVVCGMGVSIHDRVSDRLHPLRSLSLQTQLELATDMLKKAFSQKRPGYVDDLFDRTVLVDGVACPRREAFQRLSVSPRQFISLQVCASAQALLAATLGPDISAVDDQGEPRQVQLIFDRTIAAMSPSAIGTIDTVSATFSFVRGCWRVTSIQTGGRRAR